MSAQKCPSCGSQVVQGSLFCDVCGESLTQVRVARKLRQSSFDSVTDAKEGLLSPGERIKSKYTYVIEEAIARSGFGATFRATRTQDQKQLLIKQMIDQASYDQFKNELMKSFKREAKFLRKIKHPAFPRGYEYFEKNKSFFLVMDFINGRELAKALEEYRKTKPQIEDGLIVYLGIEIADALEIIHQYGFIYRDLKPQNVMLDGISSRVKLIDFGTLYHSSDSNPLLFESEGYTPPEFKNKDSKFTPAGDIFSLGALLYEIAMGETPKLNEATKIRESKCDPRLCEIIERCLEADPLKRFQRARHLRDELKRLTKKSWIPFRKNHVIAPVELSVLPKTLYPPACTFCEFCGYADSNSQAGYCPKCRVPLRVGRLSVKVDDKNEKEFFLYSDETIVGSSTQAHFSLKDLVAKTSGGVHPEHIRIFRRTTGLWLEAIGKDNEDTLVNRRKVLGPVELLDGDTIELKTTCLKFNLKDAC